MSDTTAYRNFKLSDDEITLLMELVSSDQALLELLSSRKAVGALRLSPYEAEQVRDLLTFRLAEIGFDENYNPNAMGKLIERLIDRLYLNS